MKCVKMRPLVALCNMWTKPSGMFLLHTALGAFEAEGPTWRPKPQVIAPGSYVNARASPRPLLTGSISITPTLSGPVFPFSLDPDVTTATTFMESARAAARRLKGVRGERLSQKNAPRAFPLAAIAAPLSSTRTPPLVCWHPMPEKM